MKVWNVLSPDGFPIAYDKQYKTKEEAIKALNEWIKLYEFQGFYSYNFNRIPLSELFNYCKIIQQDEYDF